MKHLLFLTGAFIVLLAGSAAAAERWPRWYVGLSGFLPYVSKADVSGAAASGDLKFGIGGGAAVALGYMPPGNGSFLDAMRFELEYSYRKNSNDSLNGADVSGDIASKAGMLNVYYDITTGTKWLPYLGLGAGWDQLELNMPGSGISNEHDSVFAYQLMAGIGYAPETMPRSVFSLGYRFFSTAKPEFSGTAGNVKTEYDVHNLEAGARFAF